MPDMAIGAVGASAGPYATQATGPAQAAGQARLTPEQQQQVQKLRQIDQKVRQHEAAHQAAGAGLAGGANYQYVRGPDGKQYAVAGEVKIDVSPAQTPEGTIDRARRIQAAALAPADPSPQDRAVAAQAAQMAAQARIESMRMEAADEKGQGGADAASANTTGILLERDNPALAAYTRQEPDPAPTFSLYA